MLVLAALVFVFPLQSAYAADVADAIPPENASSADNQTQIYQALLSGQRLDNQQESKEPDKPTVYLTFDDGPSVNTPQVLAILKQFGIHGTFFEIGEQAERYPDYVKQVAADGNSIGNHSYNHRYSELYSNFSAFWQQIQKTQNILYKLTGVKADLLRAPGGTFDHFDAFYYYLLHLGGYRVFDWNVDVEDAIRKNITVEEMVHYATKEPLQKEMIVLMHDGPGHGLTVKALPGVIRFYQAHGYTFGKLTDLAHPISFRLGKGKHMPAVPSLSQFQQYETMVKQNDVPPAVKPVDTVNGAVYGAGETSAQPAPILNLPLQILLKDNKNIKFMPSEYRFEHDRFGVSLRKLITSLGGAISWEADTHTAVVKYGALLLAYDLPRKELRISRPFQHEETIHLPEMAIEQGQLIVPLRNTINLLGDQIDSYTVDANIRRVALLSRGGLSFYRWVSSWEQPFKPISIAPSGDENLILDS